MHGTRTITTDHQHSLAYRNGKLPVSFGTPFYDALAEMAEELRRTIVALADEDRLPHLQHRVSNSAIVFGVWPEPDQPGGFGFHLIKGRGHLALISGELPDETTTAAIPCVGLEQAMAAETVWGDPVPVSNSSEVSAPAKKKAKPRSKKPRTTKASSRELKRSRRMRH